MFGLLRGGVLALGGVGAMLGTLAYHPGWPEAKAPSAVTAPEGFRWGITWHPDNLRALPFTMDQQLDTARELGVGLIRFDVRWSELEPTPGKFLEAPLQEFVPLVRACRERHLAVKVNLGTYPRWALDRMKGDREGFFTAYRHYTDRVIATLGEGVDYYQLGNEFNTILDPIPRELDSRVFVSARASIDAYRATHPQWGVKTVINVCDTFYLPWKDHLEQELREASGAIDVIGYDFYGGNYSNLDDWGAWPGIAYLGNLAKRYDKEVGICETGCPDFLGEGRQASWIAQATPALLRAIAQTAEPRRFRFAVLYELYDDPVLPFLMPHTEATFGLLSTAGRRKPGYYAYQRVCRGAMDAAASASHSPEASPSAGAP